MKETNELREFARSCAGGMGGDALRHIADRIDAEHERMYADLTVDMEPMTDESMAEHGWIRLPLDADGVPIHVGDMVEDAGVREIIERVMQIRYTLTTASKAPTVLTSIITDASQLPQKPTSYRHYHAPTVEDVLREFAEKITDSQIPGVHPTYEEAIAEYVARLRLAGDDA